LINATSVHASALRATIEGNRGFRRELRRRFDIEEQHACEVTKVAPSSDTRPEMVSPRHKAHY
jgi:hypothetical protein